tara:strand:+ start:69 stop:239 length:171 start_codon:yes stop_codon:yes gene_type:complete
MSDFPSGFGLAPIKREGSVADPDEFTWECACEACALKYQKWKELFDIQQKKMRGEK